MSDTLPSNRPSLGYEVEHSLCNSHGCRQFTEELYQYPEEIAQVLTWYGTIWQQDEEARKLNLDAKQCLARHNQRSPP